MTNVNSLSFRVSFNAIGKVSLLMLAILPWLDAYAALLGGYAIALKLLLLFLPLVFYIFRRIRFRESYFLYLIFIIMAISVPSILNSIRFGAYAHNADIALRLLYPILLYALFLNVASQVKEGYRPFHWFSLSLLAACVSSISIGWITGLGGEIMGRSTIVSGNKGFFIGANEVGIILCISFYALYVSRYSYSKSALYLFFMLISVCGLLVFTKSSLVASMLSIIALMQISGIGVKAMLILMFCGSGYYVLSYWDAIVYFFSESFFRNIFSDPVSFLFRGRQKYIEAFFQGRESSPNAFENVFTFMFGIGDDQLVKIIGRELGVSGELRTTFEMDWLDVYYGLGMIGILAYLLISMDFVKAAYMNGNKGSRLLGTAFIIVILGHSFLAGHVVYSIQVTSLLAIFVMFSKSRHQIGNQK